MSKAMNKGERNEITRRNITASRHKASPVAAGFAAITSTTEEPNIYQNGKNRRKL